MQITTDTLEAIRWDGANTAAVEAFAGRRCVDATTVLVVPTERDDERDGLLGVEPLHLARHGWLVRAAGTLRVLPPEATDALLGLDPAAPGAADHAA